MPLSGGQVGQVLRADTDGASFVVKLVAALPEPSFAEEPRDRRVYGSRWSNFAPAYELLRHNGIAVPKLHGTGTADGVHYAVMDFLDGDADDYSPAWFAALGGSLGRLHRITRGYQGWVAMDELYRESWPQAFAASLRERFEETKPLLDRTLAAAIDRLIAIHGAISEPASFAFSHTDGFQGVFRRDAGGWNLLGVVDIEDHAFTDPRFVLAGVELSHAFAEREVPTSFWQAYEREASPPADLAALKDVFQLYYLLVWTRVLKDQPEMFARCRVLLAGLMRD